MGLSKYKLGNCVELYFERCNIPNLTEWDVSGVNRDKEFFEPSKQSAKIQVIIKWCQWIILPVT